MYKESNDFSAIHLIVDCPLSILENGLNSNTIHNVLRYSLYKCSLMVDYNMELVCENTLKNYYKSYEDYPVNPIIHQLDLNYVGKHPEYEEQSEREIDELISVFKTFKELEATCIELYQVAFILKHFKIFGHAPSILKYGKSLYEKSEKNNPQPMININVGSLINFKNSGLFINL